MTFPLSSMLVAALITSQSTFPWQLRETLPGHHHRASAMGLPAVSALVFSPDEETLAIGAGQHRTGNIEGHHPGSVTLWDLSGDVPTKRAVIELPGATQALAFAPDGLTLAVADDFDALKLYDADTGEERVVLAEPNPGRGPAYTRALVFSPDGGTLARISHHWLHIWDVATGRQKTSFKAYEGDFTTISPSSLAFAPDGETFVLGGIDGRMTLRNTVDGRMRAVIKGHGGAVQHVALTRDGGTLVSAARGGAVRLWETVTGQERAALTCREGVVRALKLSPDDRTLATQHRDICLWDVSTGERNATITSGSHLPVHFAFSPESKTLTTIRWDGALRCWDVATGLPQSGFHVRSAIEQVGFSPSGEKMAMACNDATIRLWAWQP